MVMSDLQTNAVNEDSVEISFGACLNLLGYYFYGTFTWQCVKQYEAYL